MNDFSSRHDTLNASDIRRAIATMFESSINQKEPIKHERKNPPVLWGDVIGLDDAKNQLRQAIEAPYMHKEIYEKFNISPPRGVLLYGPPGCGKTMLGKAASHAMAQTHKKDHLDGFFYYNGAEMYAPHVGAEEKWLREAFEKAEGFFKNNGFPAILFFDEADSMLPHREISPPWARNAVNQFLSLMDGLHVRTTFVILATNNHTMLDQAAIRAGRIDRKIYVGPPDKIAISSIVRKSFKKKPVEKDFVDMIIREIYRENRFIGEQPFSEYINGANAAAIADNCASIAFNRCIKSNDTESVFITTADVIKAIEILFSETVEFSNTLSRLKNFRPEVTINHHIEQTGKDPDIF